MSPRAVRRFVIAISIFGIGGMIVGSIADNNGTALTFGLITAVAVLGLILVNAVHPTTAASSDSRPPTDAEAGREIEDRVAALVTEGADEGELRSLVRAAVQLGRSARIH